jgi:hypothetical protein
MVICQLKNSKNDGASFVALGIGLGGMINALIRLSIF